MATAAILAGGKSRRMGRDRAWLEIGDGTPLIQRVAKALAQVTPDLMIVGGDERCAELGYPVLLDRFGPTGALGGIAPALAAARSDVVCVAACDMPYCSPAAYRLLLDLVAEHDVAIPLVAGKWQTMHAVYRRTCLPAVEAALSRGDLRVVGFFPDVRVRAVGIEEIQRVDHELRSLIDVDTPQELARARRAYGDSRELPQRSES